MLDCSCHEPALYLWGSLKVVWTEFWRSKPKQTRKRSQGVTRNSIKQEDLKSLVDISRLPHASGNRMLQNLKDFNSIPFMSKIEHLRSAAKFYHPIEKGNNYVTTTLEDNGWGQHTSFCKDCAAPRNRDDSRTHASIDANKAIGLVLNIGIATVIDVLGIEVQLPVTKDLWKNHRHFWTTVPRCARKKKTSIMCVPNLPNLPW